MKDKNGFDFKKYADFHIDSGFYLWLASQGKGSKVMNPIINKMKALLPLAKEFHEHLKTK